jgi:pilus assembly protein Flp/PilA
MGQARQECHLFGTMGGCLVGHVRLFVPAKKFTAGPQQRIVAAAADHFSVTPVRIAGHNALSLFLTQYIEDSGLSLPTPSSVVVKEKSSQSICTYRKGNLCFVDGQMGIHNQYPWETHMNLLRRFVTDFVKNEDGPTAVEYAVMLALIVVVCIAAISVLGSNTFNKVATTINSAS